MHGRLVIIGEGTNKRDRRGALYQLALRPTSRWRSDRLRVGAQTDFAAERLLGRDAAVNSNRAGAPGAGPGTRPTY